VTPIEQPPPPSRLPWPPIVYVGAVAAAALLHYVLPVRFPAAATAPLALIGVALLGGGVALDLAAIRTLARAGTTVRPDRATAVLVTGGPYAWSRNPIYLGNTLALTGLALVFDVPWFLVLAPVTALAVRQLAILPEERHLAARFGPAWGAYAARVRRWL
jgi:protein-S-isoprenylcysteine O-methyltransferase Ste14